MFHFFESPMTMAGTSSVSPDPRFVVAVFLWAIVPVNSGCKTAKPLVTEQPIPKVTVTAVISQQTIDSDEYTGKTEASEIVEVRARVFGYLKSIEFKDGDFVSEGETLFTIEPDEYDAIHRQSLARIDLQAANLELAKSKRARSQQLVRSGAVSQEEYEETVAAVAAAEAAIAAARADANRTAVDLKYTVVKAPIRGRVDRAMVSKGNLLTGGLASGTFLTKIVNEQPMYVYFDVDERSLLGYMRQRRESRETAPGSLREQGVACYVQLADEPDFSHEGQLDFASAEVDASTGTARIRGVFANANRELVSGLFVRVRIPVGQPYEALLIPERALATDQNLKFVYVVGGDGIVTRRPVQLGKQRNEMRIITAGLNVGDRVIVKGQQRVKPGQKVDAEEEVDAEIAPPSTPAASEGTPASITPADGVPSTDSQPALSEPQSTSTPVEQ